MNISLYKNSLDNSGSVIEFSKALRYIKQEKLKERIDELKLILERDGKTAYNQAKKSLPSVTFSGRFSPTRNIAHCIEYSSLIVLDIDNLGTEQLEDLTCAFTLDKHILCYFLSPSGSGVKIIVQVDSAKEDHYSAFESLRIYFETNYEVKLDPSGKDICRLCYLAADKDLYYNGSAIPFHVEVTEVARQRIYSDREVFSKDHKPEKDENKIYALAKQWTNIYKPYVVLENGNTQGGNAHIHLLSCNLNRLGFQVESAVLAIARDCVEISVSEIKDTVRKVYKSNVAEFKTQTAFDFDKEQDSRRGALELQSLGDIITDLSSSPSQALIASGFPMRDKAFGGGKERGCAYAYVGREKTYKSVDAIREATTIAQGGLPVIYLNGEMSKRQFMQILAQQCLGIPRTQIQLHFEDIKKFCIEKMNKLKVVTGKDFKFEEIVKTVEAFRAIIGEDVAEIFIDGISHMDGAGREEIHALIENSKVAKEIAKACNEGRGAAVSILIHTDAQCNYWSRKPQSFIRGKTKVLANFDGSIGFSRFVIPESVNEDWSDFELRTDIYNVRAEDYRTTGESTNVVMFLNSNCVPSETNDDVNLYEFVKKEEKKYGK